MPLDAGTRLGPYEIIEPIGKGGMGEVYRARDTKLDRDVAIKVLPDAFAKDEERVARFEREAKLLASLNHPNIASIYGFESNALVLELVEGLTLAERIGEGPIPIDEAIAIAKQIAEALEAGHEAGIMHRDLKPANVKLKEDGTVKVLDYGLAKALEGAETEAADSGLSQSPTVTRQGTVAGMILGTAAYMSPEQARGKRVDKRADIWAFGAVVYECLVGRQLFTGETVSDVLAAVLTHEPDFASLPAASPPYLRRLLRRCLERAPKGRLRDIGEARIAFESAPDERDEVRASPVERKEIWVWALAALAALATTAAVWGWRRSAPETPRQVVHLNLNLPESGRFFGYDFPGLAISRDGRLAAVRVETLGVTGIHLHHMDRGEADLIPETSTANSPFFSPDGQWLGYSDQQQLKKVAIDGGAAVVIGESAEFGATWAPDETIIYSPRVNAGLWRISAAGGDATMLTEPDASREVGHWYPQVMPDGEHVLYSAYTSPIEQARLEVLSLESGERKVVLEGGLFGRYAPSGHLVYLSRDALMAVRFDAELLETTGLPVPVVSDVYANSDGLASVDFSDTGTLIYATFSTVSPDRQLVWVDRSGRAEPVREAFRRYAHPRLSPDGQRIAVTVEDGIGRDIWLLDLSSGTLSRVSHGSGADYNPNWSFDGQRLFYTSERKGVFDIYSRAWDGRTEEVPVLVTRHDTHPLSASPSGDTLAFSGQYEPTDGPPVLGLWLLPLEDEGDARPIAVDAVPLQTQAVFSPNGRLLAFRSNVTGRSEVYIQSLAGTAGPRQVSVDGGESPAWSSDGRELYFRNGSRMMAVALDDRDGVHAGEPSLLFEGDFMYGRGTRNYDVASDGRFLMVQAPVSGAPSQLEVVVNWFQELKRLLPIES